MSQTIVGNLAVELGMSTEEFQRALAYAQANAQSAANKMQQSINNTANQGGKSFTGFALNVSRAVDDAQYGFRGIVNNMEMIGMEAGRAFGLSTQAAMGFGAAMTLTAVAINNALPALEKMTDMRSEMDKIATGPAAFANSITMATRSIAAMQKEASNLLSSDATSGFGAFLQRQISDLAKWNDSIAGSRTLFSNFVNQLGIAQTQEQQIAKNRDAGRAANRMTIDSRIAAVRATQDQSYFDKGLGLIGTDRDKRDMTVDKDIKEVFESATKGQLSQIQIEFTKTMMNNGLPADEAEQAAIRLIGEAADGVKSSARTLELLAPSFNITKPLEEFRAKRLLGPQFEEYQDAVNKQDSLISRRDSIMSAMNRSEIIGSSDVFARNLNAGQEDPQLKELKEIKEEIKNLGTLTGILN